MMVYFTLFIVAFLSATLLPLGSEALLLYDMNLVGYSWLFLWCVATLGNTLGSVLNYWLGLKGEVYLEKRGKLSAEKMQRSRALFDKYGAFVLLLSWAPLIGDPLTFAAGVLRYDVKRFLFLVFLAKGGRYAVLFLFAKMAV